MIADILLEPLLGGFFHDDQAALRVGSATPLTPGFAAVRVPATGLGIGLVLDDGQVVWGDAMSVQYAGAGGRDPLLGAGALRDWDVRGLDVSSWVEATEAALAGIEHAALRYGISQALLAAAAAERGVTMAEVVAAELGLELVAEPVPLFVQSGEARHAAVERMIAKRVDVLPHGLFSTPEAFAACSTSCAGSRTASRARRLRAGAALRPLRPGRAAYDADVGRRRLPARVERGRRAVSRCASRARSTSAARGADRGWHRAAPGGRARAAGPLQIVADEWCNTLADVEAFAAAGACDMAQIKTPDVGSLVDSARAVLGLPRARHRRLPRRQLHGDRGLGARLRPRRRRDPPRRAARQARHGRGRGHHAGRPTSSVACSRS